MNSANRLFFFLFILGLYFFSHGSCKAFLKNLEVKNLENTPDKSEINVNNTDVVSNESYYYSLNELGIISDHLNQPTRSLSNPEMISFAEISSEIDEAEIVTNNFFRNIFFDVKSYMNTPYGICIFVILLLVFMIIILKSNYSLLFLKNSNMVSSFSSFEYFKSAGNTSAYKYS